MTMYQSLLMVLGSVYSKTGSWRSKCNCSLKYTDLLKLKYPFKNDFLMSETQQLIILSIRNIINMFTTKSRTIFMFLMDNTCTSVLFHKENNRYVYNRNKNRFSIKSMIIFCDCCSFTFSSKEGFQKPLETRSLCPCQGGLVN